MTNEEKALALLDALASSTLAGQPQAARLAMIAAALAEVRRARGTL